MNTERDRFLTEAMGECWHGHTISWCEKCQIAGRSLSFSIPNGFFKLWDWAIKQDWWSAFGDLYYITPADGGITAIQLEYLIDPDRFANTIYQYLSGIQPKVE